jgi:O-antigen ligase
LLLILLVPLGAHVLQRPQQIPLTLVGVTAILALLGVMQWRVFPSTTAFQSAIAAWLPLSVVSVQGWDPHQGRLFSTWLDPNLFGGMLVLGVAVLQTLPLPKRIFARLAVLGGSVAILVALMLTKSRTSLMAFLVLLVTSVLIARPWRRLSLLIAGAALGLILTPSFLSRVTTINRLDPTTGLRVLSWQQAIAQSLRAPTFGLGYNTYGVEQLAVGNIQTAQLHSWAGADSSPLTILATTGMWGVTLFSVLLSAAAWALLRRCLGTPHSALLASRGTQNRFRTPPWAAGAAFLGLVGLFVHAQFVQSLLAVQLAVPLALLLAAAFAERTPQYTKKTLAPST